MALINYQHFGETAMKLQSLADEFAHRSLSGQAYAGNVWPDLASKQTDRLWYLFRNYFKLPAEVGKTALPQS